MLAKPEYTVDYLTVGIREAYANGMLMCLPVGNKKLAFVML